MVIYPTQFEGVDADTGAVMFKLETVDAECAAIELNTTITPASWQKLSAQITECLRLLDLHDTEKEDDKNECLKCNQR